MSASTEAPVEKASGLRRVQSSVDLREQTFQTWCAKRGRRYLEERRNQQLKQLQEEEEAKKQVRISRATGSVET